MSTAGNGSQFAEAVEAFERGDMAAALGGLEALLHARPGHGAAWNLTGIIQDRLGRFDVAIACFQRAYECGAGAGVLANLGAAFQKRDEPEAAARAFAQALRDDPRLAIAWQKLAGFHEAAGRDHDALAAYRRAAELDPSDLKSLGNAVLLRRQMADWEPDGGPSPRALVEACVQASRSDFAPFILLALEEAAPHEIREAGRIFARSQWGNVLDAPPLAPRGRARPGGKLRVGYLSSDFRHHAVSFLVLDTIAAHDRDVVEVALYAHGPPASDPWRDAAIAAADRFVDLSALGDRAAAARIAGDGVDVLVDLNGYTEHGRMGILAHRPAQVTATWIGYIGSLGERGLADYVIGDPVATPPGMAAHFSESLALLPECFQPNGAWAPLPPPPARASEGLPPEAVVFCSFNQAFKLHPRLFDDWCAILRGVPGSVLWLAPPRHDAARANLRAEAGRRGIDPGRIVFADRRPRDAHLARIALADLALDTWPYNSGTTASDALRAGVPLLAFPGEAFVGRMAASLLAAAGMGECVSPDRGALVARAIALGNDGDARADLRRRLAERMPRSSLFRPDRMARDLERLFPAMLEARRAGHRGTIGPA